MPVAPPGQTARGGESHNDQAAPLPLPAALRQDLNAPAEASGEAESVASTSNFDGPSTSRGELFDPAAHAMDFVPEPEPESPQEPSKTARAKLAWLGVVLLAAYCLYTLGALVGERSREPAPTGPFALSSAPPAPIKVHVVGRVKKPGVYALPLNSRVQDAITKAGGALPGADVDALNLADWAQDGGKITVPLKALKTKPTPVVIVREVRVPVPVPATESVLSDESVPTERAPESPSAASAPPARERANQSKSGVPRAKTQSGAPSSNASIAFLKKNPLNLNTATLAQLEVLPGVGPKMAERIIAFRAENGPFESVDDLDEVRGIGEKRMETLRPLVRVR